MSACALGFALQYQLLTVLHECLFEVASDLILYNVIAYEILPVSHQLWLFVRLFNHVILKVLNELKFLVIVILILVS